MDRRTKSSIAAGQIIEWSWRVWSGDEKHPEKMGLAGRSIIVRAVVGR